MKLFWFCKTISRVSLGYC